MVHSRGGKNGFTEQSQILFPVILHVDALKEKLLHVDRKTLSQFYTDPNSTAVQVGAGPEAGWNRKVELSC